MHQLNLNNVLRWIFFLFAGIYILTATSSALSSGPVWDDEIEYIGLLNQIDFGRSVLEKGLFGDLDYESAIVSNLEFYGVINKLGGLAVYKLLTPLLSVFNLHYFKHEMLGVVFFNKFLCIFFFLLTVFFVNRTSKTLQHSNAYVAPLLLITLPTVVGHSWLNVKDIPFMCFYTGFTYFLIARYSDLEASELQYRSKWASSGLSLNWYQSGSAWLSIIFAALSSAARPAFLPVAVLTIATLHLIIKTRFRVLFAHLALLMASEIMLVSVVTCLLLPASWVNPADYFIKTISMYSQYPWGGCMLIHGVCKNIGSSYSTLDYFVDWFSVKVPIAHMILALSSVIVIALIVFNDLGKYFRRKNLGLRLCNISLPSAISPAYTFVLIQFLLLPCYAIARNSVTYDGLRHWLFVFPAFCILLAATVDALANQIIGKRLKSILTYLLIIGLLVPMLDIASIAPYSYAYINELFRSRLDHTSVDLDYWGASSKEISTEIHSRQWVISNIMDNGAADHIIYPRLYLEGGNFPSPRETDVVALIHRRFKNQTERLSGHTCKDSFDLNIKLSFSNQFNIASVGFDCFRK